MKTHSLSKRFLSLFLCIVFCFSLLPTAAFADDAGDTAETPEEAGVIVLEGTEDPAEEVIVTEPSTEADSSTETALTEEEELPEELEFAELERIQRPGDAEIQGRNDVATVAYADGVGYESYTSLEAAIAAAGTEFDGALLGSTIQLAMDVTQDWLVLSGKTVVLDLNGKTLTADIDAYAGDYTITNGTVNGTVYANGLDSGETGHLTIASDATIEADYAFILYPAEDNTGNGYTIDINGTVDGIVWVMGTVLDGNSVINVNDGAKITGNDVGVGLNGVATVNVNDGATITGISETGTGIEVRAGTLNVKGGTIVGEGTATTIAPNGNGTTTSGAGIAIAQHTTEQNITVNITGGEITGNTALSVANPQNNDEGIFDVKVTGGIFTGTAAAVVSDDTRIVDYITGGKFIGDVDVDALPEGYIINAEGVPEYDNAVARIEGKDRYFSIDSAVAAADAGDVVEILKADTYTLPNLPQNITIEGAVDGVVFNHTGTGSVASIPNGATFKNVAFNFGNNDYHGFQHAGAITMENCTLNGKFFSYGDMTFTNCTFNNSGDYHMWVYGKGTVTYDKCTFNGDGKFIHAYSESADNIGKIIVNDCAFNNSGNATKAALNIKETCGNTKLEYEVIITGNNTLTGSFPANSKTDVLVVGDNGLWQVDDRLTNGAETNITVTVGDTLVYPEYVATVTVGDTTKSYTSLQNALNAAATAGADATVKLLTDADLSGVTWEPVSINANKGGKCVTVNGNNKVITGLSAPLFAGTWAGNTGLEIYDLSIVDSHIKQDVDDAKGNIGVGAFIGWPQASSQIVLSNCHLSNSTVEGGHWTGGLIGVAAGYSGNDGPVFETVTITGCSVTNSTIKGKGSVGALMGHATTDAWTKVIVTGTTVTGNTLAGASGKTGILFGTAGAAGQAKTVNGVTHTGGVEVNAVESGNSGATYEIGRIGTPGGVVIFNAGGAYTVDPTLTSDPATGTIAPVENYQVTVDDGVYSITPMPFVARIGDVEYTSLAKALEAVQENQTIEVYAGTHEIAATAVIPAGVTITGAGKDQTTLKITTTDGDGLKLTNANITIS